MMQKMCKICWCRYLTFFCCLCVLAAQELFAALLTCALFLGCTIIGIYSFYHLSMLSPTQQFVVLSLPMHIHFQVWPPLAALRYGGQQTVKHHCTCDRLVPSQQSNLATGTPNVVVYHQPNAATVWTAAVSPSVSLCLSTFFPSLCSCHLTVSINTACLFL